MKTENELAGLMAERLYQLMREEATARGVVSVFLPFHKWEDASELQHEALTNVVARIMREAREQREEWTRAFIEAEVERMREHVAATPGRFSQVEESFRLSPLASRPCGFEPLRDLSAPPRLFTLGSERAHGASFELYLATARALRGASLAGRLLQLRDSLRAAAGGYECTSDATPVAPSKTAERLNLFAVELESIIYEGGLAPRPSDEEGSGAK